MKWGAPFAVAVFVSLLGAGAFAYFLGGPTVERRLHELRDQSDARENLAIRQSAFLRDVLRSVAESGLLFLDREEMAIVVPPKDLRLRLQAWRALNSPRSSDMRELAYWDEAAAAETNEMNEIEAVLAGLHDRGPTDVGKKILSGVQRWNDLHAVAAVRDDLTGDDAAGDADAAPGWRAAIAYPSSGGLERARDAGAALSYFDFGYFGLPDDRGRPPATGDWLTARGAGRDGHGDPIAYTFRRRLPAGEAVTIDVIGAPGAGAVVANAATGAALGDTERLCEKPGAYDPDTGKAKPGCPRFNSASFRVVVPAHAAEREAVIAVRPVAGVPSLLSKPLSAGPDPKAPLRLNWATCGGDYTDWNGYVDNCRGEGWIVYGDGRPVVLLCRLIAKETPTCAIDWVDNVGPRARTEKKSLRLSIETSDGVRLVDLGPDLETLSAPDPRAREQMETIENLGLQSLIGSGPEDAGGLIGGLWAKYRAPVIKPDSGGPDIVAQKALTLSIDAKLQRAVAEVVEGWTSFGGGREVAVTIVDASGRCWTGCAGDRERGAIRAAYAGEIRKDADGGARVGREANFDRGAWNYLAANAWLRKIGGKPDDLVSFAWFSDGSTFAPGSTFKSMTALAAIEQVVTTNAAEIEATLRGRTSATEAVSALPLPEGVAATPGYVEFPHIPVGVPDANCGPSRAALKKANRARICNLGADSIAEDPKDTGCPGGTAPRIGLCEAARKSRNSYFIALGAALERHAPSHVSGRDGDTPVVATMRRLFPEYFPLLRSESDLGHKWSRFNANSFSAVESAENFATPVSKLYVLGQNAYGHNMQTNTATIASLYASIATGCAVRPWLDGGTGPCDPLFSSDPEAEARGIALMRETLVPGLWAVINKGGSAAGRFQGAPFRKRVHAKTGTAGFGRLGNTAWLAGWIDPAQGAAEDERYAFACMVTRTKGQGGQICGPLMRAILERIEAIAP